MRDSFVQWAKLLSYLSTTRLVEPRDEPRFAAKVDVVRFGSYHVSETFVSHATTEDRTEALAAQTNMTTIVIQLIVSGSRKGEHYRDRTLVGVGDVGVLDLAEPYYNEAMPGTVLALAVPRSALPPALRERHLHGLTARQDRPAAVLFAHALRALCSLAMSLTEEEGLLACDSAMKLFEAVFVVDDPYRPPRLDGAVKSAFERSRVYIERHLGDADLSVEAMSKALRLSRSQLYRLFEGVGGIGAYMRERRLLRAYEVIAFDLAPNHSLAEIGYDQGFRGDAQFSRAFRKRFGMSPGAVRKVMHARRARAEPLAPPYLSDAIPPLAMLL